METRSATGATSFAYFDVRGREVRTATIGFSGEFVVVDREFDLSGRLLRESQPYFAGAGLPAWTSHDYDAIGRPVSITAPASGGGFATSTQTYDGLQTVFTDAYNRTRTEQRNVAGDLEEVTDAIGGFARYTYDPQGNMTVAEQGIGATVGSTTTISYDLLGRKVSMDDADMGLWTYAHNAFGELISQTDAKGQRTEVRFDLLGRMIQRDDFLATDPIGSTPVQRSTWAYTLERLVYEDVRERGAGGLETTPEMSRDFLVDGFGRVDEVHTRIGSDLYVQRTTFDEYGRVFQEFDASGMDRGAERIYGPNGHLARVDEARISGSQTKTYYQVVAMDAFGNVREAIKGGSTETRLHDPRTGHLDDVGVDLATSQSVYDLSLQWDLVGNLTSRMPAGRWRRLPTTPCTG